MQCVVKTYLEWLQDSEYEPATCGVCKGPLSEENAIRLLCLGMLAHEPHPCRPRLPSDANVCCRVRLLTWCDIADVLHSSCLDAHVNALPPHTANAGYACPVCSVRLHPLCR